MSSWYIEWRILFYAHWDTDKHKLEAGNKIDQKNP